MRLQEALDACRPDRASDWQVIPDDAPGTNLLEALVDAGDQNGPSLTTFSHLYRAVYDPDARLGLGWGMNTEEPRYKTSPDQELPDWAPAEWTTTELAHAHVLLNGLMIWRVSYIYVNVGAAIDGLMPLPKRVFEAGPGGALDRKPGGYDVSRQHVELVGLLNALQENSEFDYERELRGWGLRIRD